MAPIAAAMATWDAVSSVKTAEELKAPLSEPSVHAVTKTSATMSATRSITSAAASFVSRHFGSSAFEESRASLYASPARRAVVEFEKLPDGGSVEQLSQRGPRRAGHEDRESRELSEYLESAHAEGESHRQRREVRERACERRPLDATERRGDPNPPPTTSTVARILSARFPFARPRVVPGSTRVRHRLGLGGPGSRRMEMSDGYSPQRAISFMSRAAISGREEQALFAKVFHYRRDRNNVHAGMETVEYGHVATAFESKGSVRTMFREVQEYFEVGASISPGATVVDVGANIGAFAIAAAKRCRVSCACFASNRCHLSSRRSGETSERTAGWRRASTEPSTSR